MNSQGNIRKKKKYICPNPLFVKWLTEWKEEAAERGLKTQYTYAKALSSLKKYPLPLSSGKEAKILEFFGDKICSMLDAKLKEWKQENSFGSISSSQSSSGSSSSLPSSVPFSCRSTSSSPKKLKQSSSSTSSLQPSVSRSCSNSSSPKRLKQSCSRTSSSIGSSSVASSCDGTSFSPKKNKEPAKVSEAGIDIRTVNLGRVTTIPKTSTISLDGDCDTVASDLNSFYLFPESFSIVLCVDNCETFSGQGRNKKLFLAELQKSGVSFDVRKLHVGDFLWVARENNGSQRELVLDFIVERKRMDDLARSIKDGRFKEQKFRMKTCGLKNPIYLVEKGKESNYLGLPLSTCEQAIVNTQVIDGFMIKRTLNVKESVSYLSTMTNMIRNKYQNLTLMSASKEALQRKTFPPYTFMTFSEFNTSSIKNKSLTVREMFAKHLLQFFGLSVEKAAAIVDKFDTPSKFLEAYDSCVTESEKEKLVSVIKYGLQKKNVGPALSRSLYQFYCAAEIPPK